MVTVGYGDITPNSDLEKGISIVLMFLSCGVFGYTMNKIGNFFVNRKDKSLIVLKKWMSKNGKSSTLSTII